MAAILAADIAGYSALMGADEAGTVRSLKEHQAVVLPIIKEHGGRIIDIAGDGILAEFASVVNAAECAVAIQRTMAERNAGLEEARRMRFRIGINQGDIVFDDTRVYGDGVNVAARLESLAEPGGICISRKVYEEVAAKISRAALRRRKSHGRMPSRNDILRNSARLRLGSMHEATGVHHPIRWRLGSTSRCCTRPGGGAGAPDWRAYEYRGG